MKFKSQPIAEHDEAPLADEGRFEALVETWTDKQDRANAADGGNLCFVACVGDWAVEASRHAQLQEILSLVSAQGDTVVGHVEMPQPPNIPR